MRYLLCLILFCLIVTSCVDFGDPPDDDDDSHDDDESDDDNDDDDTTDDDDITSLPDIPHNAQASCACHDDKHGQGYSQPDDCLGCHSYAK